MKGRKDGYPGKEFELPMRGGNCGHVKGKKDKEVAKQREEEEKKLTQYRARGME